MLRGNWRGFLLGLTSAISTRTCLNWMTRRCGQNAADSKCPSYFGRGRQRGFWSALRASRPNLRRVVAADDQTRAGGTEAPACAEIRPVREAEEDAPWDMPIPFGETPVPGFPTNALSPWLHDFVEAEANATQTPQDLTAMLVLAAISASCAGKMVVHLKDGYDEPLNLFVLIVLSPGNRKTAVFRAVTEPVEAFEAGESDRMRDRIACAHQRRRVLDARLKLAEDRAAKAEDRERGALLEEADRVRRERDDVIVPVQPRLIVDDCSPEKLASMLHEHGGRIALLSPEGDAFDIMAGRYSSNGAPNLGVYLKGHSGDPLRVDRQGRAAEFVSRPALTLGITTQPEILQGLIARPGFRGRGLLARFLYSVPKSTLGRRNVDPPPVASGVRAAYALGIQAILRRPAGTDETGSPAPHVVATSSEARSVLLDFERRLEPQLGEYGELAHVADWAAKLVGAIGRIAGLLHVADLAQHGPPWEVPIARECAERAVLIGHYLVTHACAAFGQMGADPDVEHARFLLAWLKRLGCEDFTKREAFEGTKGRFKRVAAMEPALAMLEEYRYVRPCPEAPRNRRGRRPSPTYEVNPASLSRESHISRISPGDCANRAKSGEAGGGAQSQPSYTGWP